MQRSAQHAVLRVCVVWELVRVELMLGSETSAAALGLHSRIGHASLMRLCCTGSLQNPARLCMGTPALAVLSKVASAVALLSKVHSALMLVSAFFCFESHAPGMISEADLCCARCCGSTDQP